jgi:hypothetical protein
LQLVLSFFLLFLVLASLRPLVVDASLSTGSGGSARPAAGTAVYSSVTPASLRLWEALLLLQS